MEDGGHTSIWLVNTRNTWPWLAETEAVSLDNSKFSTISLAEHIFRTVSCTVQTQYLQKVCRIKTLKSSFCPRIRSRKSQKKELKNVHDRRLWSCPQPDSWHPGQRHSTGREELSYQQDSGEKVSSEYWTGTRSESFTGEKMSHLWVSDQATEAISWNISALRITFLPSKNPNSSIGLSYFVDVSDWGQSCWLW